MRKILWMSQHSPLPRQIEALCELFGKVEVEQDPRPFDSAEEIARRYRSGSYDDIVVVAPLWVILKLCELEIKPLWAQMDQVGAGEPADLVYRGRRMHFAGFRRVIGVELKFEQIVPAQGGEKGGAD